MSAAPILEAGRYCYYVPESQDPATHGGYVPSIVIENDPGHYPMMGQGEVAAPWVWGKTLDEARSIAAVKNARLGLTQKRVAEIIASSMAKPEAPQLFDDATLPDWLFEAATELQVMGELSAAEGDESAKLVRAANLLSSIDVILLPALRRIAWDSYTEPQYARDIADHVLREWEAS